MHDPQREWDAFGAGQPEVWLCVPSRVEIFRPIGNFVQHGRERGGRPQSRIEDFGLPVQDLVQEFLGERIPLVGLVDNQQAITAVKRGKSKRLKCLNRTHRIAIGSLHEIVGDERQRVEIRYIESKLQKGQHLHQGHGTCADQR